MKISDLRKINYTKKETEHLNQQVQESAQKPTAATQSSWDKWIAYNKQGVLSIFSLGSRMTRAEFWCYVPSVILFYLLLGMIFPTMFESSGFFIALVCFGLEFFTIGAAMIRRMHDIGISRKHYFYVTIPVIFLPAVISVESPLYLAFSISYFVCYLYWALKDSDRGTNKYGASKKYSTPEQQ